MKKILPLLFILFFVLEKTDAQVGGDHIYEFLNLSNSARVTGLGGNLITVKDDDVALAYSNPSLLNPEMHQALSFNYNFHLSDISNGYVGYAHHLKKQDINVLFVNLLKQPRYMMERIDIIPDLIPNEHIFKDFKSCLQWIKNNVEDKY